MSTCPSLMIGRSTFLPSSTVYTSSPWRSSVTGFCPLGVSIVVELAKHTGQMWVSQSSMVLLGYASERHAVVLQAGRAAAVVAVWKQVNQAAPIQPNAHCDGENYPDHYKHCG